MAFSFLANKNNAGTTLAADVLPGDGTITVASAAALPAATPYLVTVYLTSPADATMEIMRVTNVVGEVLTVTRAQEGTAAVAHVDGDQVWNFPTAGKWDEVEDAINTHADSDGSSHIDQAASLIIAGTPQFAGLGLSDDLVLPKTSGKGIKVDNTTPAFGWRDLRAEIRTRGVGGTDPNDVTYIGTIKAYTFSVNDQAWIEFHIPHDYVAGTDIHLHFHWSHNSATVTGGNVTWEADVTYAKGHNQAAFPATVNPTLTPDASTTQYQHMVSEVQISTSGGAATQIDTDDLEPDGVILARVYLSANNITSGNGVPDPFLHEVDVHYQSSNIATKNKVPNFYT